MKKFFQRKTVQVKVPPVTSLPSSIAMPWQRITLSLVGIAVIMFMWRWATFHLYALPPHSISAFNSITNNSLYVVGALVVFFVSGKLIYDWKNQTISQVIQEAHNITEDRKEEHTERVVPAKYFDDPAIP